MRSNNLDSFKEGSCNPRAGSKRFTGDLPPGTNWLLPHSLAKLKLGGLDANDPRYVGEQNNIWRVTGPYSHDVLVSTGLSLSTVNLARWEATPYNAGDSGTPFMYFAHPARMLKDDSTFNPLRRWGIPPPTRPPTLALGGAASGGPNGAYTYLYTFRNPQTGAEGNPCALPVDSAVINPSNQAVEVTYFGADTNPVVGPADRPNGDPAITGLGSIAIYRAGGTFADNLYRFVGYGTNPGYAISGFPNPAAVPFEDTIGDLELVNARTIEFDNDMPVTSSLPIPFVATIQSEDLVAAAPYTRLFLTGYTTPSGVPDPNLNTTYFTPGSLVTIGTGNNQETCVVFNVGTTIAASSNFIDVLLQNGHSLGEQVSCDANAGKPCDLVCLYQDAILLAGDPNNPHVVYRSKSGRPDAFPVIDLEDGNAHQLNVGSPSNPIMGIAEFNGEVVCLNQQSIFVFIVLSGAMSQPQKTPSDRGLIAKHCWCKVKNEIWFLSYDGIYSWAGGDCQLRSEAIHSIFNSPTKAEDQTYFPIDYSPDALKGFDIECIDQEVWLHYADVTGATQTWRYQLLYDRWIPAAIPDGLGAMMTERDTGRLIVGIQDNSGGTPQGFLQQQGIGTSENWNSNEGDGAQIFWDLQTGYVSPEERTRKVQFTELLIEILNPAMPPGDLLEFSLSYDYATNPDGSAKLDPVDSFEIISANPKRTFLAFPLQVDGVSGTAEGKEAMSVSLTVRGQNTELVQVFSWTLRYIPLQEPTKNSILDWQSLGSPNDKQLYCLAMEFDPNGQIVTLLLDIIAGVPGAQVPEIQQIVLQPAIFTTLLAAIAPGDLTINVVNPTGIVLGTVLQVGDELLFVTAAPAGTVVAVIRGYLASPITSHAALPDNPVYSLGRVKQTFPIVDNVIAKSVRLRPVIPDQEFQIFAWEFEPIEKYPPDIVYFSELTDNDYAYLKFYNQISLDVDTGGVTVTVGLELDGAIVFTFPVNTDRFTRYGQFTCPALFAGVNARVVVQLPIPPGGKFQMWGCTFQVTPADKGPVRHTTDWDDLGTQFDKQLQTITFEYDGSAGDIDMQIEELSGIHGDIVGPGMTVRLVGANRAKQQFAFPDGHIAKMIRVHPASAPAVPLNWKSWTYAVGKIDFPPDFILFTDLTDNGSPYLKFFNQIVLEVDTGGQPVIVLLELDGIVRWEFTVTATRLTRRQAFVCPQQLAGINARILIKYPLCLGVG